MTITITAFERSPDGGKGLARDTRVRWALEEVGQPYEVRLVSFKAMKEPAHLALHPFGQIPTYEEGDLGLFETGAIVFHIAQRHAGLLPPNTEDGANARARAITWMFAALSTVEPPILELATARILEGDKPWTAQRMPLVQDRVRNRLGQLSPRLGDADWLDGAFSAGDLMMVSVLLRLRASGLLDEHPNLAAYVARGEARPAYKRAFDAQLAVNTPQAVIYVAPMMDWTDRHCRYFLRQVSSTARLYTEMITTGALIHGDVPRHLDFSQEEHPVALQLGGSEPDDLARCAKLGEKWGYDEINLNIGCPSERVQRGAFGACLMAEPMLVAECVAAIRQSVKIPVTVKHRVGLDKGDDYAFVRDFVATVAEAGCTTFIAHARNAVLKGLSPKENREIPPLKYDYVYRLKKDFPHLNIVINGGIVSRDEIEKQLAHVDGVMLGRAAYHNSWVLADEGKTRAGVVAKMAVYAGDAIAAGFSLRNVTRHMLGLYHATPRARLWRRMLSDSTALERNDPALLLQALDAVESGGSMMMAA